MLHTVSIAGLGSALPEHVMTNFDLEKMVDTSDEWIRTRTGIKERRIAPEGTAASDLGKSAALKALEISGVKAEEIELLIVATYTPDKLLPSTACILQHKIQAYNAAAFDINAACSGFLYALSIARQFIQTGAYKNALVVGVDVLSRFTDYNDRSSCILFGDGAGAAVLLPDRDEGQILNFKLGGDGRKAHLMDIPGGGSLMPATQSTVAGGSHYVHMNGNEIFRFAVKVMEDTTRELVREQGLLVENINWLVPHQANWRIIAAACNRLRIPSEKAIANIERVGNTSSASVPLAMDEAVRDGKIKKGDLLALVAFGAGLTWGGCLVKW